MTTEILTTFTNEDDGVSSFVFLSNHKAGGYGVSLRDDDSGEFVGVTIHGNKTYEAAVAKAKEII